MVDEESLKAIEAAVREAERKTAGEIRVCIARRSSPFPWIPALLVGALAAVAGYFAARWWAWGYPGLADLLILSLGGTTAAMAVVLWLWPKRRGAARERAILHFHRMGMTGTAGRTGVLLYLSLAEHQAVLLADRAINEKVPEGTWQGIIDRLVEGIRARRGAGAVAQAVGEVAERLAAHFPRRPDDVNELPDRVEKG